MKRSLALVALAAAAFVPAAPASANHLCIYSNGQPVYCAPHFAVQIDEYCIYRAGQKVICVP